MICITMQLNNNGIRLQTANEQIYSVYALEYVDSISFMYLYVYNYYMYD